MIIHTITMNGMEVSRTENVHDYVTAQFAVLGMLTALRIRYDFQINTYQMGEDTDRCLSIHTDPDVY